MKLYWKIYLVMAATTLVTLVLSIWISFSVLPAHFERLRAERIVKFEYTVMNMQNPHRTEIEVLADSMDVVLRFFRNNQRPPMPHGHPPSDREWRGIKLIQPPGTDFSILASGRVAPPRFFIFVLFALGLFLSQALALAIGLRSVFSRISTLRSITGKFGEGDFSARYPSFSGGDEIDKLGSSFNRMADRIISLLGSHKELLNSVAHELRTPMARLSFALELARENPQAAKEKLGLMEQDIFELDRLVSELLEFNKIGNTQVLAKEQISLQVICIEAIDGNQILDSTVKTTYFSDTTDLYLYGNHRLLLRAVSNLIRNAIHYAETTVGVQVSEFENHVEIAVTDDGPGFLPDLIDRAISPFVKGYDSKGSGLGLSIVNRIAEQHGGSLFLANKKNGGSRVTISIPKKKQTKSP